MRELDQDLALLRHGRISRREFVGRALASGATTALIASLLSGPGRAGEPKKGGTLRANTAEGQTTNTLDPATMEGSHQLIVACGIYNRLAEVSSSGGLVPELAESWEPSLSADTWVFRLRRDVEFHNGKPLDASDVVASVNHHRGEESKSAVKSTLASIAEIKTDGKDQVLFTLSEANADFPYILSDVRIPVMPATDGNVDPSLTVGTGGYILKRYEPGVQATLERNPGYWKEGRAHFDGAEVYVVHDVGARQNAVSTGEADIADQCDPKTVHLLEKVAGVRVDEVPGMFHLTMTMQTDTPPFNNNDVRLALKYGVDREAMVDTILRGHGTVGNDHPISRSNRFYAAELEQRQYDPDKAKFHLKRAGLSRLKVDLRTSDAVLQGAVDAAVLYREHTRKADIELNIIREPSDGYWSDVWLKKPFYMSAWSGRPTEDMMFTTVYAEGANWNETHWKHERFNQLLKLARAELDESKRREMYFEMQRIVRDEGGAVIPLFTNYLLAMSDKLQHDTIAGNWNLDGFMALERWWFA